MNNARFSSVEKQSLRAGETGGRRIQKPRAETKIRKVPSPASEKVAVSADDLVVLPMNIRGFNFLRRPAVLMSSALIAALLGLYVLNQVIQALSGLATLSPMLHAMLLSLMLLMLGVVLFVLGRLILMYFGLPVQQAMSIERVRKLDQESKYSDAAYITARELLGKYLRDFRVDDVTYEKILKHWGMNDESYKAYCCALRRLKDTQRPVDSRQWVAEFQDTFLVHLNNVAEARCSYYASLVGIKTAISPWKLVDTCAILYNSLLLVRDMCHIYKRRASRTQSLTLLFNVAFNMYVGGEAQGVMNNLTNWSDSVQQGGENANTAAGQQLAEGMQPGADAGSEVAESFKDDADGMLQGFKEGVSKIPGLKMIAGKLAEGGFNYLLVRRLGRRVIKALAPVVEA